MQASLQSGGPVCLLIIFVQGHRFDGYHLVVFLLVHLHVRVEGFQLLLNGLQSFRRLDSPALLNGADHPPQHNGVGVPGGYRELGVAFQVIGHGLQGAVSPAHHHFLVVLGGGKHAGPREHENGSQAEQRKVNAKAAPVRTELFPRSPCPCPA